MSNFFNIRSIVLILMFIFGLLFSIPSIFDVSGRKISLGLDLQGGVSMLFGVNLNEAIANKYSVIASHINTEAHNKNILLDSIRPSSNNVSFELIDVSKKNILNDILMSLEGVNISEVNGKYIIIFDKEEEDSIKDSTIKQAIDIIRKRINIFGLTEPSVTRQGYDNVLVQIPGVKNSLEEKEAMDLIMRPAFLKMMAVDEKRNDRVEYITDDEARKYGDVILPFANNNDMKILLNEVPILDGSQITDARVARDSNTNLPVILFTLNGIGSKVFANFSGDNIGNRMAIVLDNKVYSAPVINERIGGGSGQISGAFSEEEATSIAIALRSGALNTSLDLLEKRSVGPSLGADSIKSSLIALFGAFLSIIIFMIIYYGISGMISVVALFVNVLCIIAVMSLFKATLTLPGMAGIVLTIGMAIDANIIINERIREAIRRGDSIIKSISFGYANATRAIFDANNTTLIVAILLYAYGTGPIQGFAITMGIGICISIITAIMGTHGIYIWLGDRINNTKYIKYWFGIKAI